MKIEISNCINIYDLTIAEQIIFCDVYANSKIAFKSSTLASNDSWELKYHHKDIEINSKNKTIYFPVDLSVGEYCYAFRCVLDAIAILKGIIPIHGACIKTKHEHILVLAESGNGKSHVCNSYCKRNNASVIGDDHIWISNCIYGNKQSRLRDSHSETYLQNTSISIASNVDKIITLNLSDKNAVSVVDSSDIICELYKTEALKYTVSNFRIKDKEYSIDDLFSTDIIAQYLDLCHNYFTCKNPLLCIEGTIEFLYEIFERTLNEKGEQLC